MGDIDIYSYAPFEAEISKGTDRHCRVFHRTLSRRARLYTEMVTTGAILHGDQDKLLGFNACEHPVALQLGGSDPEALRKSVAVAVAYGYDEYNLNCGCPSERVQKGAFGASLMLDAPLVVPERHAKGDRLTGLLATWFGEHAGEVNIAATYNLSYNGALLVREGVGRMVSFDGLTTVGPGTGLEFRLLFPPLVSVIDLAWKRDVPLGDAARRLRELVREDDSTALGVRQRNRSESEYAKEMDDRYRSMRDGNETEHDLVDA